MVIPQSYPSWNSLKIKYTTQFKDCKEGGNINRFSPALLSYGFEIDKASVMEYHNF